VGKNRRTSCAFDKLERRHPVKIATEKPTSGVGPAGQKKKRKKKKKKTKVNPKREKNKRAKKRWPKGTSSNG